MTDKPLSDKLKQVNDIIIDGAKHGVVETIIKSREKADRKHREKLENLDGEDVSNNKPGM